MTQINKHSNIQTNDIGKYENHNVSNKKNEDKVTNIIKNKIDSNIKYSREDLADLVAELNLLPTDHLCCLNDIPQTFNLNTYQNLKYIDNVEELVEDTLIESKLEPEHRPYIILINKDSNDSIVSATIIQTVEKNKLFTVTSINNEKVQSQNTSKDKIANIINNNNQINKETTLILSNPIEAPRETIVGDNTPVEPNKAGLFYQEARVPSQCSIHAINSFLGFQAVNTQNLTAYNIEVLPSLLGSTYSDMLKEGSYAVLDAQEGSDPTRIVGFLTQKALDPNSNIESKYKNMVTKTAKAPPKELKNRKIDRVMIGANFVGTLGHTITLRQTPEKDWVLLDSLEQKQHKFSSIQEFCKVRVKEYGHQDINFMFIEPNNEKSIKI